MATTPMTVRINKTIEEWLQYQPIYEWYFNPYQDTPENFPEYMKHVYNINIIDRIPVFNQYGDLGSITLVFNSDDDYVLLQLYQ